MVNVKDMVQNMLLKIYGEDKGELDGRVSGLEERVEARRKERRAAGVRGRRHKPHTAKEYEDWMNIEGDNGCGK